MFLNITQKNMSLPPEHLNDIIQTLIYRNLSVLSYLRLKVSFRIRKFFARKTKNDFHNLYTDTSFGMITEVN